jgi:hypothetical protein
MDSLDEHSLAFSNWPTLVMQGNKKCHNYYLVEKNETTIVRKSHVQSSRVQIHSMWNV